MELTTKNGYTYIIDDEDFIKVSQYNWYGKKTGSKVYILSSVAKIRLHRFIMNVTDRNIIVDHIDSNGLNNSKQNLRLCDCAQNARNRLKSTAFKTKYKGVRLENNRWRAEIRYNNIYKHLGMFETEEEAAKAYDIVAKELFGDFAKLNFPIQALDWVI